MASKKTTPAKKTTTVKKKTARYRYAKPKEKKPVSAAIVSICVTVVLVIVLGGAWFFLMGPGTRFFTFQETSIAGINLSGMSKEEAMEAMESLARRYAQETMVLEADGHSVSISPEEANCQLDVEALIDDAFAEKPLEILDIAPYLSINSQAVRNAVNALADAVYTPMEEPFHLRDGETIYVTTGIPCKELDRDSFYTAVMNAYANRQFRIEGNCKITEPAAPDLETLYNQYCTDAVDAVLDPVTYVITEGIPGYGFDLQQAQEAIDSVQPGETVSLTMGEKLPAVTAQDLWSQAFPDVLSTCSTPHSDIADRTNNLRVACESVNGTILYPGDVFSFNETLGERTPERGYLPGASYEGGRTVYTYGGGICQVSSTMYYCTLYADLEIVERWCHMYSPDYIDWGIDATVNWGTLDYQFRNNSDYPIYIEAYTADGYVTVTFYGTDNKDYYVEMYSEIVGVYNYQTVYKEFPPDNEEGYVDGQVIDTPITGYGVDVYRNKYDKETKELISSEYEDYSDYDHRDHVICKIVVPETQPTETTVPAG